MAYIGAEPVPGQNREVDDISSGFNGNATAFTLQVSSVNVSPESANNILINLGGVLQNPGTDYTIAASTITFTTAPASGLSFFGLILGAGINTATVADQTIGTSKVVDNAITADKLAHTSVTAGSYTTADITVDAQGRITAAANGNISQAEIANDAVGADQLASNAVVNDSVASNAAIAGSKISPNFGSQAISTTGGLSINGATVFNESGADVDFRIEGDTNANLFYVDAGNDAVGIGTSSPLTDAELTISAADTPSLAFQRSGTGKFETAIAIDSGHFHFKAGADSSTVAGLSDVMKIESTGNVGIGTTSPGAKLHAASGSDSVVGARITGGASGGTDIADFRTNNGTIRMKINNDVTVSTGNLVIGTSGKGIDFGVTGNGSGTMTSELFSDYEEGTWTPTTPSGGGGWNSVLSAMYRKVGNVVFITFYGNLASQSSTNALKVGGFPYAAAGSNHYAYLYGRVEGYASSDAVWQVSTGSSEATFFFNNNVIGYNNFSANNYVLFSGFYFTA